MATQTTNQILSLSSIQRGFHHVARRYGTRHQYHGFSSFSIEGKIRLQKTGVETKLVLVRNTNDSK